MKLDTSNGNNSRHHVYSYLKAVNGQVKKGELEERFPNIAYEELIEGVLEYDNIARRPDGIFSPFKIKR